MTHSFESKVVVVTGAGSGIGEATARAFSREGAHVILTGRRPEPLARVEHAIKLNGGSAEAISLDVADEGSVRGAVESVVSRHGRIDAAFLNAGIALGSAIVDQSLEDFEAVLRINTTGLWLCLKHMLAPMYRRREGSIVANLSVHASRTIFTETAAYTASKHAAAALVKSAAIEAASHNVRVNGVSPGPINTEMLVHSCAPRGGTGFWSRKIPMQRVGTPDEIASAVLWLASGQASFITGSSLAVDGGFLAL